MKGIITVPPKQRPILWPADPHTIAKIAILKSYLLAWFQIMGITRRQQGILYMDGFAGPGGYTNYSEGSPIAALLAAQAALSNSASRWIAGDINCVFIEEDRDRYLSLVERIAPFHGQSGLSVRALHSTFLEGLGRIRDELPTFFSHGDPLFVFIDPFGPTAIPFQIVADLLGSPRSEVLIYFDTDGIARIFESGASSNASAILDRILPDQSWRDELSGELSFSQRCRKVLELYRRGLRSVPNVRFTFPFEIRSARNLADHYLLFASQHPLGLEKMKEAMRTMDQTGEYQFSDAHIGQARLFRFDSPAEYAEVMYQRFHGFSPSWQELTIFALEETPFLNPKKMLEILDRSGRITVRSSDPKRRKGTFNEAKILRITFKEEGG
jgi:three-Cys-motif partner protein